MSGGDNVIPERIQARLDALGIDAQELHYRSRITERTIQRWLEGKVKPDADSLRKLAHHLRTSTDYILGITDSPAWVSRPGEGPGDALGELIEPPDQEPAPGRVPLRRRASD